MGKDRSWIPEGLVAGFIGYITVVGFFGLVNLAAGGAVFETAERLGTVLFYGGDPAAAGPGPILSYNGVHLVASLLIGLGAAWLVFQTEKNHPLWFLVFFVFLSGFIYAVALMGVVASEMAGVLSWPAIVMANLVAGATAGAFLWWRHRKLVASLAEEN